MLTETAGIGLAGLIPALHMQENHTEFDENGKKLYINEHARYGAKAPLRRNALLLYLYILFSNPDKKGFVRFHMEDAAEKCGCSTRTVLENLKLLSKREYASFQRGEGDLILSFICDYKSFFLTAKEGGRGYLTMPRSVFDNVCALHGIDRIRVALRTWVELSTAEVKGRPSPERSYKEMKRWLPDGRTISSVKEYFSDGSYTGLFSCAAKKSYAVLSLTESSSPQHTRTLLKGKCGEMFEKLKTRLDKEAVRDGIKAKFSYSQKDLSDAADIAMRLPLACIEAAAEQIWREYRIHNIPVKSYGALLRTIAEDKAWVLYAA